MGTDSHMHTYTHQGHEGMFQASVHKYIRILALGNIWTQAYTCTHIHIAVNLQEVSQQSFTTFDSKFHHYTHTCTPTYMYTLRWTCERLASCQLKPLTANFIGLFEHIAVNLQEVSQLSFTTFDSKFRHYIHTCTPTHMYTLRWTCKRLASCQLKPSTANFIGLF